MRRSDFDILRIKTNNTALIWKETRGIAPDSVADKMDDAMLSWMVEPNKMKFEDLKNFSIGILFENNQDALYLWIDKIQHYRNAVHAFNYRDIGTTAEFITDMGEYNEYVDKILNRVPSVEDYIECYPAGYISNVYFE